jgi:hypothetical protein
VAKSDFGFDLAAYAPVAERIRLFWTAFPNGRVETRLVSRTEHDVVFEARVYRSIEDSAPAATGWAAEREGDGDVNAVACLENTETSAIGRALANLGFTAAKERPSVEEMQKAARTRAGLARQARSPRAPTADARQSYADLVTDLLGLLDRAVLAGLRSERAHRWRRVLLTRQLPAELLVACERRLRAWVEHRPAGG